MVRCIVVAVLAIIGFVPLAGCLVSGSVPSTRYVFEMDFEDMPRSEQTPPYVLFEEERTVCENVETTTSARLTWAALAAHGEANLEYRMPVIRGGCVFAGMASTAWASERRFTVFSPGYAAATVLPYGRFGNPPKQPEPANRWDAPAMFRAHVGELGTRWDVDMPISCSRQTDGAYHSVLPVRKLTPPMTRAEAVVFKYQVWALACAIKEGRLNTVSGEIREAVCDAVARQHDCWGAMISRGEPYGWWRRHQPTFAECAQCKDMPCAQIMEWADKKKPTTQPAG